MHKHLTPVEIKEIIQLYQNGYSTLKIGKKYNKSHSAILSILQKNNIKRRKSNYRKLNVDTQFFDIIDTEEKAYWLGFILTDGCVYKNKLNIHLSLKDKKHLEKFKKSIKAEYKIGVRKGKFPSCQIQITSTEIIQSLLKHGVCEQKTGKEVFPNLKPSLIKHFLRGVIDGDGHLTFKKSFNNPKRIDWTLGITSANLIFLKKIQQHIVRFLNEKCGYFESRFINHHKYKPYYILCFSGNARFDKIVSYLYDNSSVYLDRKYARYKKFKETYI